MTKTCMQCFISGRVQGVWFRQSTREQAQSLQITGWVRNLADGGVEVLACGEAHSLESLLEWLQLGPSKAQVDNVDHTIVDCQAYSSFDVR